jgi:hypothetical protein
VVGKNSRSIAKQLSSQGDIHDVNRQGSDGLLPTGEMESGAGALEMAPAPVEAVVG